jgi:hypothetical protein
MPNGHDKNWVRLCAAIDGFRGRYGRWPKRVRLSQQVLTNIRDSLLTPEDFALLGTKVELIADEVPIVAEDDLGGTYNYGREGFPRERSNPRAADWLGVQPKHSESD